MVKRWFNMDYNSNDSKHECIKRYVDNKIIMCEKGIDLASIKREFTLCQYYVIEKKILTDIYKFICQVE
jgi:hypothetical protein